MKKILEVLRYGENDIRFRTDIDPLKDPNVIHETVIELAMAMMTTLWGGNEQAVLAMIRALSIADLGCHFKTPTVSLVFPLTLDVGYLFTAAPGKCSHCSLPWTRSPFLTLNVK